MKPTHEPDGDMLINDIAVIIPFFNGGKSFLEALKVYIRVSDCVIIVDNGSKKDCKTTLRSIDKLPQVTCIWNEENNGVARALNQGVKEARKQGKSFVLTMDQDTLIDIQSIHALRNAINIKKRVVSVGANYRNVGDKPSNVGDREVSYLITSGNLIWIDALAKVGGYDDSFFVDGVDIEVSFALACAGFRQMMVGNATMAHSIGCKEASPSLGIKYYGHTPIRYYYANRNNMLTYFRYARRLPRQCMKLFASEILSILKVLIIERNKIVKLRAIALGIGDGIYYATH